MCISMQMLTAIISQTVLFLENEQLVIHCLSIFAIVHKDFSSWLFKEKAMRMLLLKEVLVSEGQTDG